MVERRTPEREVGVRSSLGRRVVSLSKIYLPPKSTGNTQEAVAPSRHDRKINFWGVKQKRNETKQNFCKVTNYSHKRSTFQS